MKNKNIEKASHISLVGFYSRGQSPVHGYLCSRLVGSNHHCTTRARCSDSSYLRNWYGCLTSNTRMRYYIMFPKWVKLLETFLEMLDLKNYSVSLFGHSLDWSCSNCQIHCLTYHDNIWNMDYIMTPNQFQSDQAVETNMVRMGCEKLFCSFLS